jgi:glycosyltransferase involved in cell wall biosynthesis
MHIAFILSSLRLSGGVILVVELANRLVTHGHTVTLVTPRQTIDAEIQRKLQPAITVLESHAGLPAGFNLFGLAYLVASLAWRAPAGAVIVATHTPTTLPVLLSSWLKRQKRLWLLMDYPEMFRTRPVEQFLLKHAPRWFSAIVAISEPLAAEIQPRARGQVALLRPGLGLTVEYEAQSGQTAPSDAPRILYVGDDRPRKGLNEFLQAMQAVQAIHPDARAVIVCKNPCHIDCEINHELHVRPNDADLAKLYRACDLFVSTSWGEGLGYPALQAMAFGKPVVATDSGGVHDYAEHGINALIVPAQNAEAVANAVLHLLEDAALRARLLASGQQTAVAYDWDKAAATFESVLNELTQASSR